MYYNQGIPFTEGSGTIWFLIIGLVVLGLIIFFLIFKVSSDSSKRISPENCPVIEGDYGVIPNVDPTNLTIVNQCSLNPDGSPGTQSCTFTNNKNSVTINNLYDAENICNKYSSEVCNGFYFNSSTLSMSFYVTTYTPSSSTSSSANNTFVDVYTRQTKNV
jgi:hypothetical protein